MDGDVSKEVSAAPGANSADPSLTSAPSFALNSDARSKEMGSMSALIPQEDDGKAKARKEKAGKQVPMRDMFRFATWYDVFLLVVGVIMACTVGVVMVTFTIIAGEIFDKLNSPDPSSAKGLAVVFVYLGLGMWVAATLQFGCFTMASERMTLRLRQEYLEAILKQDAEFFDADGAGSLTSSIAENAILYREALGEKFGQLFQFAAMFLGGLGVGFSYSWQLTLVVLAVTPFLGLAGVYMMTSINKFVSGQISSYAKAGAIAEETFLMIRTVTSFGIQQDRVDLYEEQLAKGEGKSIASGKALGYGFGMTMFIYYASYTIAFYVGAVLIRDSRVDSLKDYPLVPNYPFPYCNVGELVPAFCTSEISKVGTLTFETAGDVCACALCRCGCFGKAAADPANADINLVLSPDASCTTGGDVILTFFAVVIGAFGLGQASPSVSALTKGRVAAYVIYEVMNRVPKIREDFDKPPIDEATYKGGLKFENVAFTYPSRPDAPIYKNLNLEIPAGKRVALVGQSGSGKSTVIALVQRLYDPDAGRVLLDGVDLRDLRLSSLRSKIGLVSQEPVLFAASIRENIALGLNNREATDEEIIQACKDANAHDFIMGFPDGYDTFAGGSSFAQVSGGQKQRLCIARAILRDPSILLLDEATSALDNTSEQFVNEAIQKIVAKKARTIIVIAHRLSTIATADRIIVMERGEVVEEGTHSELAYKPNGTYASLLALSEHSAIPTVGSSAPSTRFLNSVSGAAEPRKAVPSRSSESPSPEDPTSSGAVAREGSIKNLNEVASKSNKESKPKRKHVPLKNAFRFARPEFYLFPGAILAAVVNGATMPVFALLLAEITNTLYLTNSSAVVKETGLWALGYLGLAAAAFLSIYFQNRWFGIISTKMTTRVRSAMFRSLLKQEIAFHDARENNVGALTSRLSADAASLKGGVSDLLAMVFMNVSTVVVGLTIAFVASWKLSLIVFALFPVLVAGGAAELYFMTGMAKNDQELLKNASQTLSEAIQCIRTVMSYQMQTRVVLIYKGHLAGPLKAATKKGFVAGMGYGMSQAVNFFAYALLFSVGVTYVVNGEISFRDLNQSLFGVLMSAMALGQSFAMTPDFGKGQSACDSVFEIIDRESAIDPTSEDGAQPSTVLGDASFEGVQFSYPSRPAVKVLKDLDLTVPRGATVAFCGQSGSGKSTIVNLLQRLYDADEGSVLIEKTDVKSLNLAWLRSQIGVVSQEPVLFDLSIMENIRYGKLDATDEECIQAAKSSNAYDFIMALPDGFNTRCGPRGSALSGGQRQRVAIARAIVRNPRFLLLDEATAALDEKSQRVVQEALDKLLESSSRTTFVVAHRLSSIRNATVIHVFEQGHVIESGTFDELVAMDGAFARLLQAQEKQGN